MLSGIIVDIGFRVASRGPKALAVHERVFIAGARLVGLVAATHLARCGVPITVFEQGAGLSEESRASTFHPPTLDMLDALGAADPLIAQGLKAPAFQYRSKKHGLLAQFDFAEIADVTQHPYRVQCEQSRLTRILYDQISLLSRKALRVSAHTPRVSRTA